MARNIKQVYDANPSTTLGDNDLIYVGKSPYSASDDSAIKKSDLLISPQYTYFVTENGNNLAADGTFNKAYADPFAAMLAKSGTATQNGLINIQSPGGYTTLVDFPIKPHMNISSPGALCAILESGTEIVLDASWGSVGASDVAISTFTNLMINMNIDIDFSIFTGIAALLQFTDCHFGNSTIFRGRTGKIPSLIFYSPRFPTTVTFEACDVRIMGGYTNDDIVIQGSASGGTGTYRISNHRITDDLTISGVSGSTQNVTVTDTYIGGDLTLDGTFCTLTIDATSIPAAGVTLTNGALASQITHVGNAPTKSYTNSYTGLNYTPFVSISSSLGTTIWTLDNRQNVTTTLTQNTGLVLFNQVAGTVYTLQIIQDSTPRTVGWPAAMKWPQGVAPIVSTGSGAVDIFTFLSDGTNMYCIGIAQNIS